MKLIGIVLVALSAACSFVVWYALMGIDASNMLFLERSFGPGHPASRTYDDLYSWAQIIAHHSFRAERLAFIAPISLFILGVLLIAWSRDRRRLRTLKRDEAHQTI